MKTFKQYLLEKITKNTWTHLLPKDKEEYHQDLIQVVDQAYKHTSLGSFVKSIQDVKGSDWVALDYDKDPDVDIAIFYRQSRSGESWSGNKIQGIGHDGTREAKDKLMNKVIDLLSKEGWWIEASDAMAGALRKRSVHVLMDKEEQKRIFPGIIRQDPDGSYVRTSHGNQFHETIFGHPK